MLYFLDPATILQEEYSKTPCKRYMTVGDCAFGFGCRYSHYTPHMIWELQQLGNHPIDHLSKFASDALNFSNYNFIFSCNEKFQKFDGST